MAFPHVGEDETCVYCDCHQTDEQAEHRTVEHIARDLAAIHRIRETLRVVYGFHEPGHDDDLYDLLCEFDTATRAAPALAEMAVAR